MKNNFNHCESMESSDEERIESSSIQTEERNDLKCKNEQKYHNGNSNIGNQELGTMAIK